MTDVPPSDLLKCLEHIVEARVALELAFIARDDGVIEADGHASLADPVTDHLLAAHVALNHLCDTIGRTDPGKAYLMRGPDPT